MAFCAYTKQYDSQPFQWVERIDQLYFAENGSCMTSFPPFGACVLGGTNDSMGDPTTEHIDLGNKLRPSTLILQSFRPNEFPSSFPTATQPLSHSTQAYKRFTSYDR